MANMIRLKTVKLLARFLKPLCEEGLVTVPEQTEILAQLRHLAEKGETLPPIPAKLVDQTEAAEMLGVSYSNFKKLEREGKIPFPRKMLGSCVRYRNLDIFKFIMAADDAGEVLSPDESQGGEG